MDSRSLNNNTIENENKEGTGHRPALFAFIKSNKGFFALVCLFLISLTVNIIARNSETVAEWLAANAVPLYTKAAATVFGFLDISFTELFALMLVPLLIALYLRCRARASLFAAAKGALCLFLAVAALFMFTSVCYYRKPLATQLGIERKTPSVEELLEAMQLCNERLSVLCEDIPYDASGEGHFPLSYDEIANELNESFNLMGYDFLPEADILPKPLSFSKPMASAGTTGVFLFLTGEANYNTVFPDFVTVYAMAHELAHQRGIMREDEASFMGFLACVNSKSVYIRYAGYVSMLNSLANAALRADEKATLAATAQMPKQVAGELSAYGHFLDEQDGGFFRTLTNALNHAYLKSQQQPEGIVSYSLVVELATVWLINSKV